MAKIFHNRACLNAGIRTLWNGADGSFASSFIIMKGTMPTREELTTLLSGNYYGSSSGGWRGLGMVGTLRDSGDLLVIGDYARDKNPTIDADNKVYFNFAEQNKKFVPEQDGLASWFIHCRLSTGSSPYNIEHSNCAVTAINVGSVGDLDSDADLKFSDPNFTTDKEYKFNDFALTNTLSWASIPEVIE